jgi:putative peptidoglycan lipid II flippase
VVWNIAMIAALLWGGGWGGGGIGSRFGIWPGGAHGIAPAHTQPQLAVIVAIGSVVGSALQFAVQLPTVLGYLWPLRLELRGAGAHVRTVSANFFPVFLSRGVVQISAYIDAWLGSFLGTCAVSALGYAQTLYTLPVSLFGMAVSAAELPAMSSAMGTGAEIAAAIRQRLTQGIQQIAFFVIPSAVGFLILGDVIVATIYRSGAFQHKDVLFVWAVLAGSAVGLLASTMGRLYSSAFYALRDTRTPLRFAVIRVALTLGLGYLCALPLPHFLGIAQRWGAAGLTVSAGIAGWVEFLLLRRGLQRVVGPVPSGRARILRLWAVALLAALAGYGIKLALPIHQPLIAGPCILIPYAALYLGITQAMGIASLGAVSRLFTRRR